MKLYKQFENLCLQLLYLLNSWMINKHHREWTIHLLEIMYMKCKDPKEAFRSLKDDCYPTQSPDVYVRGDTVYCKSGSIMKVGKHIFIRLINKKDKDLLALYKELR